MRRPAKPPSAAYKRTMLNVLLLQREQLDTIQVESLARSYGMATADVVAAIGVEKRRRQAQGRVA